MADDVAYKLSVSGPHQYLFPPKNDAQLDDFMDSPLKQFLLVFLRFDLL